MKIVHPSEDERPNVFFIHATRDLAVARDLFVKMRDLLKGGPRSGDKGNHKQDMGGTGMVLFEERKALHKQTICLSFKQLMATAR